MALVELERLKIIVEIVAIICAGGWAAVEFGLKEAEARRSGDETQRANLTLTNEVVALQSGEHWVLSRLTLKNSSKRVVRTFLVSWWYEYPPDASRAVRRTPIINDTTEYTLVPGEESEVQRRKLVRASEEGVLVHAEVVFESTADGMKCRIANDEKVPDGGVETMNSQPRVCAARPTSTSCTKDTPCEKQDAESLVSWPVSKQQTMPDAGSSPLDPGAVVRHTQPAPAYNARTRVPQSKPTHAARTTVRPHSQRETGRPPPTDAGLQIQPLKGSAAAPVEDDPPANSKTGGGEQGGQEQ